jgi:hypothetical protein
MDATDAGAVGADGRLQRAMAAVRRERRRTTDELEAIHAFEHRVRSIDAETMAETGGSVASVAVSRPHPTSGLRAVRTAYEETVMSVPHYVEEYDDSYAESLREEFSPDLASALTDGTNFNQRCKQATLSAGAASQSARESLVDALDAERESLSSVAEELSPIIEEVGKLSARSYDEAPFGTLDAYRARLVVLEDRCNDIATDRQTSLFEQRRARWLPSNAPDIARYVYQNEPFEYPVMSTVADLTERIREVRSRIERAMGHCRP